MIERRCIVCMVSFYPSPLVERIRIFFLVLERLHVSGGVVGRKSKRMTPQDNTICYRNSIDFHCAVLHYVVSTWMASSTLSLSFSFSFSSL